VQIILIAFGDREVRRAIAFYIRVAPMNTQGEAGEDMCCDREGDKERF
jgi:hypothetical protein